MTNILETLLAQAQFLSDRLDELDWSQDIDELGRQYNGHVDPAHCRLRGTLDSLPADFSIATGPWLQVGKFEPDPYAKYLVMGSMRLSVKEGRDIDHDNIAAARIMLP